MTEATSAKEWDAYKQGLSAAIFMKRTGATTLPTLLAPDAIKALEEKIARLETKLKSGTLSATENATFTTQLAKFKTELSNSQITLTAAEQTKADATLDALEAGKDLILDEGEDLYELAILPFTGTCASPGKKVGPACWYLGAFGADCIATCTANARIYDDATLNFAGSGGTDANCGEIAKAFSLTFSAGHGGANYGCNKCGPTCGAPWNTGLVGRGIAQTIANGSTSAVQRFCACK